MIQQEKAVSARYVNHGLVWSLTKIFYGILILGESYYILGPRFKKSRPTLDKIKESFPFLTHNLQRNNQQQHYWVMLQCPHSEEEDSVATICGFGDKFHDLRVQTH